MAATFEDGEESRGTVFLLVLVLVVVVVIVVVVTMYVAVHLQLLATFLQDQSDSALSSNSTKLKAETRIIHNGLTGTPNSTQQSR